MWAISCLTPRSRVQTQVTANIPNIKCKAEIQFFNNESNIAEISNWHSENHPQKGELTPYITKLTQYIFHNEDWDILIPDVP